MELSVQAGVRAAAKSACRLLPAVGSVAAQRSFHQSNSCRQVAEPPKPEVKKVSTKKLKSVWKIPGIPILPVVGSWPFLFLNKHWNYNKLHDFYSHCFEKYGPIFRLQHPGIGNVVFIIEANDVRTVMLNRDIAREPHRGHFDALVEIRCKQMELFENAGMVFSTGEELTRVRKAFNELLLEGNFLNTEAELIDEITREFVTRIRNLRDPVTCEVPANFLFELLRWGSEATTNSLTGIRRYNIEQYAVEGGKEMSAIDDTRSANLDLLKTEFEPQRWRYYETKAYKDLKKVSIKKVRVHIEMLDARLRQLKQHPSERKGTVLEAAMARNDLQKGEVYSALHDLIGAGLEVTPYHASKILYCLAKHPDAQIKLRQETESVMASTFNDELTGTTLRKMTYLKAFVRETLRFLPTALATNRRVISSINLQGYTIPAGWWIEMPLYHMGLHEANVKLSQKFIPERFIGRNNELMPAMFGYQPFSFGTRQCIGRNLAQLMLRNFAARMVQHFDIEYSHGELKQYSNMTMQLDGPLRFTFRDRPLKASSAGVCKAPLEAAEC